MSRRVMLAALGTLFLAVSAGFGVGILTAPTEGDAEAARADAFDDCTRRST